MERTRLVWMGLAPSRRGAVGARVGAGDRNWGLGSHWSRLAGGGSAGARGGVCADPGGGVPAPAGSDRVQDWQEATNHGVTGLIPVLSRTRRSRRSDPGSLACPVSRYML